MLRADDDLIDAIAERVEQRLARSGRGISQHRSDLGSRTHRAAVNRRIERKEGGAYIIKGRFYLTPEAYQEEVAHQTAAQLSKRKRNINDELAHHRRAGERREPRKARDQSPELDALQREITGGLRSIREVR